MKRLIALVLLTTNLNAIAGPRLNWNYYNKPKECWEECDKELFGQCITYKTKCNYRTANFTNTHKALVKDAMNKLSNRINTGRIASCIFDNRRRSYGVSANDAHKDFTTIAKSSWLPRIHLHAYRENINFTGRAEVQRIVRHIQGSHLRWSREPKMYINLSALESSNRDLGFDAASDSLAGTIIHEFLHKMGHAHPKGYNDGNYVTVVGDCVASDGSGARNAGGFGLHGHIGRLFKYGPK